MLAEGLAVIGRDDDQRGRGAGSERCLQDPANLRVALRDLVVIAVGDGPAGAGVPVGCVRLEEVHPEKPPFSGTGPAGPAAARASSTASRPGRSFSSRPRAPRGMRSPYTAKPAFRPKRRSSGNALTNAPVAKPAAERVLASDGTCVDANAVVPRTVPRRIAAGHQRRVRRQGDRRGREGAIEARATGRQTIDVWRPSPAVTVRAETIGAQSVNRDEDQITRLRAGRWHRRRAPGRATAARQPASDPPD